MSQTTADSTGAVDGPHAATTTTTDTDTTIPGGAGADNDTTTHSPPTTAAAITTAAASPAAMITALGSSSGTAAGGIVASATAADDDVVDEQEDDEYDLDAADDPNGSSAVGLGSMDSSLLVGPPRKKKRRLTEEQIHQLSLARDLRGVTGKKQHTSHRLAVAAEIGLPESAVRNWLNNHKRKRGPAAGSGVRGGTALAAQAVSTPFGGLPPYALNTLGGAPTGMNLPTGLEWNMGVSSQPSNLTSFFLSQPNQFTPPQIFAPQTPQSTFYMAPNTQFGSHIMTAAQQQQQQQHQQHQQQQLHALQQHQQQQQQQQQRSHLPQGDAAMMQLASLRHSDEDALRQAKSQLLRAQQQQHRTQTHPSQTPSASHSFTGEFGSLSSSDPIVGLATGTADGGSLDATLIPMLQARLAAQQAGHAATRAAELQAQQAAAKAAAHARQQQEILAKIEEIKRYNLVAVEAEQQHLGDEDDDSLPVHMRSDPYRSVRLSAAPTQPPVPYTAHETPRPTGALHDSTFVDAADALVMAASAVADAPMPSHPPILQPIVSGGGMRSDSRESDGDTFESLRAQIRSLQEKLTDAFRRHQEQEMATAGLTDAAMAAAQAAAANPIEEMTLDATEAKQDPLAAAADLHALPSLPTLTHAPTTPLQPSFLRLPSVTSSLHVSGTASGVTSGRSSPRLPGSGASATNLFALGGLAAPAGFNSSLSSPMPLHAADAAALAHAHAHLHAHDFGNGGSGEMLFDKALLDHFYAQDLLHQAEYDTHLAANATRTANATQHRFDALSA